MGVDRDTEKAAEWYKKSAENGNRNAQYQLGRRYYFGNGVNEKKTEAVKWYQKAAEQNHAEAPIYSWRMLLLG